MQNRLIQIPATRLALLLLLFLNDFQTLQAQRIPNLEKEYFPNNKPKNFTIWAAKYAALSYRFGKQVAYASDMEVGLRAADSATIYRDLSLIAVDSAVLSIGDPNLSDSLRIAVEYLRVSVENQQKNYDALQKVFFSASLEEIRRNGQNAMFAGGNAAVDAYTASLYISGNKLPEEEELVDVILVKRLEVDESVFSGLVSDYEDKVKSIDAKIETETDGLFDIPDDRVDAANAKIDSLIKVREMLMNRLTGTNQRLKDVSDKLYDELSKNLYASGETPEADFGIGDASEKEVIYDPKLPTGLTYQVQIGYYSVDTYPAWADKLFPVFGYRISNQYIRYSTGIFYSYFDTAEARAKILEFNVPDAFIIAYLNGEKISTSQAIRIERKQSILRAR
ncbi:MAG: hypothetical protein ACFB10_24340 [Salibacteraceae bacterium]